MHPPRELNLCADPKGQLARQRSFHFAHLHPDSIPRCAGEWAKNEHIAVPPHFVADCKRRPHSVSVARWASLHVSATGAEGNGDQAVKRCKFVQALAVTSPLIAALDEYLDGLRKVLSGLSEDERRYQPDPMANHVDFIAWHMARNEDWTISQCLPAEELWTDASWRDRLGFATDSDGCGFTPEDAAALPRYAMDGLLDYFAAARDRTRQFVARLDEDDLTRTPFANNPTTLGQAIGHLVVEQSQHLGQIAYVRGLIRGQEFYTSWNNPDTPAG